MTKTTETITASKIDCSGSITGERAPLAVVTEKLRARGISPSDLRAGVVQMHHSRTHTPYWLRVWVLTDECGAPDAYIHLDRANRMHIVERDRSHQTPLVLRLSLG